MFMLIVKYVLLGFIQGVTEFLPISSSGHLVLVADLISFDKVNELALAAMLNLATVLAIIVYFRSDIWILLQTLFRKLEGLPVSQKNITLLQSLIIGTIPAAVAGFFLESLIDKYFFNPLMVAVMLSIVSFFFIYVEWRYRQIIKKKNLNLKISFIVGLAQILAILPGVSRSGSTIGAGMLLGLSRIEAVRFSFLLGIPISLGVGLKKYLDLLSLDGDVDWGLIFLSCLVAFVSALVVIHFFLKFIRKYTFWPFVWYGFMLSIVIKYLYS